MGLLEIILILLIIGAVSGRGRLGLGLVLDVLVGLLVIVLIYRLFFLVA